MTAIFSRQGFTEAGTWHADDIGAAMPSTPQASSVTQPLDLALPSKPNALRFVALALLGPALLAMTAAWLSHTYGISERLRQQALQAFDRRVVVATLIPRMTDAESAQRGFIITGSDRFLVDYEPARRDVFNISKTLKHDLADEPVQFERLNALEELARLKFKEMDRMIAQRRAGGTESVSRQVAAGAGRDLMERMRAASAEFVQSAQDSRDESATAFRDDLRRGETMVWFAITVLGLLTCATAVAFWRQSVARYQARLQAYEIAERNRTILDSTIDAMAIISPDGRIETINRTATAMLGYSAAELIGQDVGKVTHAAFDLPHFHTLIGLVDGRIRQPYRMGRTLVHRDGHEITVDVALGVIDLPGGCYVVVSARDVSERKRVERMKDVLISTISHELRTPLTSVVGALGLLRGGAVGPLAQPATRLIEIAENNSRRLIRLINDMLDIDRIQSGTLSLNLITIDLRTVVDRATVGSQGLAAGESVQVVASDMPDAAVSVPGDADRLLQVVTNLVSNAVRATPTGGVVTIALSTNAEQGTASVTVDDEGPGVPIGFRDRIFGRFERADGERGVGTGLGLAISREIIARHGGRIWFEDRPGGGSRFGFVLDLDRTEEKWAEPSSGSDVEQERMASP